MCFRNRAKEHRVEHIKRNDKRLRWLVMNTASMAAYNASSRTRAHSGTAEDYDVELYHFPTSNCSRKVRMVLAEKGVEAEDHILNLHTFQHFRPDYVLKNKKAVVPTLMHQGRPVSNSLQIMRYLDQQFTSPRLVPFNPKDNARMEKWLQVGDMMPMRELTYSHLKGLKRRFALFELKKKKRVLKKLAKRHRPLEKEYLEKLREVEKSEKRIHNEKNVQAMRHVVSTVLEEMERDLVAGQWLAGRQFTLADVMWAAVFTRLQELGFDRLWKKGGYPKVEEYFTALKQRESYKKAIDQWNRKKLRRSLLWDALFPATVKGLFLMVCTASAAASALFYLL